MPGKNKILYGIGVSPGFAIGRACLINKKKVKAQKHIFLQKEDIAKEVERFKKAVLMTVNDLEQVKTLVPEKYREQSNIIDAYILLAKDIMIYDATCSKIMDENINAEWALLKCIEDIRDMFTNIDDDYLKGRIHDVKYVSEHIMNNLTGKEEQNLKKLNGRYIIVADDLSPIDTARLHVGETMAFITSLGGKTSHTAIVARAFEIPAIVGLENAIQEIDDNDLLILDGATGMVIVDPDSDTLQKYYEQQERFEVYSAKIVRESHLPAETTDHYRINIMANVELLEEVVSVIDRGAEGIGLYRTEFLYMNNKELPSEDELYNDYREIAEIIYPKTITIRTLDIGGDKFASHLFSDTETNPAMGLRAIRFCLRERGIFKTQLRSILRASSIRKNINIMFPMISGVNEIRQAKSVLEEVKNDLRQEKQHFDEDIKIGLLIEVPSAMVIADLLAREVDFFSIGTNDLIQYALAIDRVNKHVAHLYDPLHPAVIRMIRKIVDSAHNQGISVSMCGEMAGEPMYVPILLGLGLDGLSMSPFSVPRVKKVIRQISMADSKLFLDDISLLSTASDVNKYLLENVVPLFPDDFPTYKVSSILD